MKITVKTLQQKQVSLQIDPSGTVANVKQVISESAELATPAIERQKLIHSGKILLDEQSISETTLKEGDFVVLMITNPTAALQQQKKVSAAPTSIPAESLSATESKSPIAAESALVTGPAYEEAIGRMVEMGFSREAVIKAMKAGFNNPDRAVEYLTTGFPNGSETVADAEATASAEVPASLDFLRTDPQFRQLRLVIQQNPQLIGPVLEQLGQSSPALFGLIEQHRDQFIALMNEPDDGEGLDSAADDDDDEDGEGEGEEAAGYIEISEADKEAIDRLVALGFDRARAVEAFLACDKNEQMAANFLFDNIDE